jgi:predicted transcriptional regulator
MSHLNIYVSRDREKWLREQLEEIARTENRSLSYIVEEALVHYVRESGRKIPLDKRKDHRSRVTQ